MLKAITKNTTRVTMKNDFALTIYFPNFLFLIKRDPVIATNILFISSPFTYLFPLRKTGCTKIKFDKDFVFDKTTEFGSDSVDNTEIVSDT